VAGGGAGNRGEQPVEPRQIGGVEEIAGVEQPLLHRREPGNPGIVGARDGAWGNVEPALEGGRRRVGHADRDGANRTCRQRDDEPWSCPHPAPVAGLGGDGHVVPPRGERDVERTVGGEDVALAAVAGDEERDVDDRDVPLARADLAEIDRTVIGRAAGGEEERQHE
jgi:hypothetical protein